MSTAQMIVKSVALVVGTACYILLIFFHSALLTSYEKLIVCAVFSGFLILYLAFALGLFMGNEIDSDLNSAWALYGVAAYVACGILCIINFSGRGESEAVVGVIAGSLAIIQAGVLAVDVYLLQQE